MKKKIVKLPQQRCDECAQTKVAFGFVRRAVSVMRSNPFHFDSRVLRLTGTDI